MQTIKPSLWLGISVGFLTQLGLKTLLPVLALFCVRFLSLTTENDALWLEDSGDSSHPVWYVLQASIFLGSAVAGALAAVLSLSKSWLLPAVLVLLSLQVTWFEQFPLHLSPIVLLVWTGGPCLGLVLGIWLARFKLRLSK